MEDKTHTHYKSSDKEICPVCLGKLCKHYNDCVALAQMGLITAAAAAAAKKITEAPAKQFAWKKKGGSKRGGSVQRATSGKRVSLS